jgi:hypothetical protein
MTFTSKTNFDRARSAARFTTVPILGNVFFADSVTGSSVGGYTPDAPAATIAQALALCTANKGDIIYVAPGHVESIGAAGLAWNVAGVRIVGLGYGANRPTLTWHTTDAVVTISAASMQIENIITKVDLDEVVSMFLVTGANVTFDTVDFYETASAQAIQWLLTTNAADQIEIKNCYHVQMTAAGSAQKWIQLVGVDNCRIHDNIFLITAAASTSSHLISGSTALVNAYIARNTGLFIGATITIVINCVTGSTGYMGDNKFGSGTSVATAAAFTGDAMFMFDNKWADTAAASGLLAPAVDTDT